MVTLFKKGSNCLPNNRSVSFEVLSTCYQLINVNCWSKWINCQRVSTANAFQKSGATNLHCIFHSKAHFRCRGKAYIGMYSNTSNLHSNLSLSKSDCKRKAVRNEEHGQLVQNLVITVKRLVKIGDVKSRFCCTY